MRIKLTSLRFESEEAGRLLSIDLNSHVTVEIRKTSPQTISYKMVKTGPDRCKGELSKAEFNLCKLVYSACWNYLNGDEPQSMDYEACAAAGALASRFDWKAGGYPTSYEPGEPELFLSCKIALYENV